MQCKKREIYNDLPLRSDPNYMKLYRKKNRQRLDALKEEWYKAKMKENPNYNREKYDAKKAAEYRRTNKAVLMEKQWRGRGIIDLTYVKFQNTIIAQNGRCKMCGHLMDKPQADHNHKTGEFRSVLCIPCNNGLGYYELYKEQYENYLRRFK